MYEYKYNDRDRECVSIEREKSVYKEREIERERECVCVERERKIETVCKTKL